jgi:GH15 family glucan-1,4-alpha-glucosidase
MPLRIEDCALIGDSETAALVGRNGSIDWLCWPRFDSDACFAGLLGTPEHGRWLISPADAGHTTNQRHYRRDTLILETRFETKDGAMRLVDFMPPRRSNAATNPSHSTLIRLVIGERRPGCHANGIGRVIWLRQRGALGPSTERRHAARNCGP